MRRLLYAIVGLGAAIFLVARWRSSRWWALVDAALAGCAVYAIPVMVGAWPDNIHSPSWFPLALTGFMVVAFLGTGASRLRSPCAGGVHARRVRRNDRVDALLGGWHERRACVRGDDSVPRASVHALGGSRHPSSVAAVPRRGRERKPETPRTYPNSARRRPGTRRLHRDRRPAWPPRSSAGRKFTRALVRMVVPPRLFSAVRPCNSCGTPRTATWTSSRSGASTRSSSRSAASWRAYDRGRRF